MRVHCPTCLEVFTPEDDLQCPPCGHVFHHECIRKWLDSKRGHGARPDCPQCRKSASSKTLLKIFLAEADGDTQEDRDKAHKKQLDQIQNKLELKDAENTSLIERIGMLESNLKAKSEELSQHQKQIDTIKNENRMIRTKMHMYENEINENEKFKDKWLKSKKMLQDLEDKQGNLRLRLVEAVKEKEESERKRKEANKMREQAEMHSLKSEERRKILEDEKRELEEQVKYSQGHRNLHKDSMKGEETLPNMNKSEENDEDADLELSGDWWGRVDRDVIIGNVVLNPTNSSPIREDLEKLKIKGAVLKESDYKLVKSVYLKNEKLQSFKFCLFTHSECDSHSLHTVARFLRFIKKIRAEDGCVYVPLTNDTMLTLVGYYLMISKNCSPEAAVQRLKKIRPEIIDDYPHGVRPIISDLGENLMALKQFYSILSEVWISRDSRYWHFDKQMEEIESKIKESENVRERDMEATKKLLEGKIKESEDARERDMEVTKKLLEKLKKREQESQFTKKHFFIGMTAVMMVYLCS